MLLFRAIAVCTVVVVVLVATPASAQDPQVAELVSSGDLKASVGGKFVVAEGEDAPRHVLGEIDALDAKLNNASSTAELEPKFKEIAANISALGNALQPQIDQLSGDVNNDIGPRVQQLRTDVDDAVPVRAQLRTDVNSNAGDIADNKADITNNANDISGLRTDVDDLEPRVQQLRTDVDSAVPVRAQLRTDVNTNAGAIGDNTAAIGDNANGISDLRTDVDNLDPRVQLLRSDVDTNANNITNNANNIGRNSANIDVVRRDAASDNEAMAMSLRNAFDAVVSDSVACAQVLVDRQNVSDRLDSCLDDLAACNAANTGSGSGSGSSSSSAADLTVVHGIAVAGCGGEPCSVTNAEQMVVYGRGVVYTDLQGIYWCKFLTPAGSGSAKATVTPATATKFSLLSQEFYVTCPTPTFKPAELPAAEFESEVSLVQGTLELPFRAENKPRVAFKTAGPVIAPLADPFAIAETTLIEQSGAITINIAVSDVDTLPDDIAVAATFTDAANYITSVASTGTGGTRTITVQVNMGNMPAIPTNTAFLKIADITVTATDTHAATDSQTFELHVARSSTLIFNLNPRQDDVKHYNYDRFWTSTSDFYNQDETTPWNKGDIKTQAYVNAPMGDRVKLVAHMDGEIVAEATYSVAAAYRGMSFRTLLADHGQITFATKMIAASTSNRPVFSNPKAPFVDNNGNQGQPRGDLFFDFNDNLVSNKNGYGNAEVNLMRLATDGNSGGTGGHVYGGVGGYHRQGSWCIAYEYEPNTGYCATYNRYGAARVFPNDGNCVHHPYGQPGDHGSMFHGGCYGDMKLIPVSLAMFVDA